ncbi:lasso peptide biosynthesis PqqD family chaperone [Streptomyces sp. P38-E01]|uniref:Lasso peptide biosynthesis PqqD family chaperone n=1 Tax=Streptomyces tardus TaxID=2780544 RepID=A0A949JHW2_9ACTN|nr:lasso peptide biosynthesis PqqD family chaperone [Streptomyces tardus]MBU7600428.1 lasso peptide biosynthesis PqqD family chaperone [Streptomyces tardus]
MPALRDWLAITETDYGSVLLDMNSGSYWNLNHTGAIVVDTLRRGGSAADAVTAVRRHYDIGPDEAERDVADLLDQLRQAGILDEKTK